MKDYPAAFRSFQSANEIAGQKVEILIRLAIAASFCGNTGVFERSMAQVFKLEPENVDALRFLARLNMTGAKYDLAAQQYRRILRQIPDDTDSLLQAGSCYLSLDNLIAAKQMFELLLRADRTNAVAVEKLNLIRLKLLEAASHKPVPPPAPPANTLETLIAEIRADKIGRAHFAHGLLLATLQAMKIGVKEISVFEFGVLHGNGLLNLCSICQRITEATGFKYRIYGFDSDVGMPPITDYRDHPEIWYTGQFKVDHALTKSRLPANAELIVGDIGKTILPFCKKNLSPECPVGFVVIDVDLYSSTKSCFKLLKGKSDCYLPAVVMYFDDVNDMITLNSWCGEALAIKEFNRANKYRKIEEKWTRQNSPNAGWHDQFYCCHILDHPVRSGKLKCASLDLNVTIY
jgi:tetratricopeptide (TPR) repeat protein